MQYKYVIWSATFALLALASCKSRIDVSLEDLHHTPTINYLGKAGIAYEGERQLPILVSQTAVGKPTSINDASIELWVDGTKREQVQPIHNAELGRSVYPLHSVFSPGQSVELRTHLSDGSLLTAKQIVPAIPTISKATIKHVEQKVEGEMYTTQALSVSTTVRDTSPERNYYRLIIYLRPIVTEQGGSQEKIGSISMTKVDYKQDLILNGGRGNADVSEKLGLEDLSGSRQNNDFLAFDDQLFKDGEGLIRVFIPAPSLPPGAFILTTVDGKEDFYKFIRYEVIVLVEALTEDGYRYYRSIGALKSYDTYNPFSSPIQIYSNIKGGTGIFSIASRSSITIKVH